MNLKEITSQVANLSRHTGEFVRKAAAEFIKSITGKMPIFKANQGFILFLYFPIQNLLKIFANKSSVVICPVISPK